MTTTAALNPLAAVTSSPLLGVYKRPPIEIVGGEGVYLRDAEGKQYLDFVSGIAVNALGYGDEGLMSAFRNATEVGLVHTSNLYHTSPAERLARALVDKSFADAVFFCNSGAEANEGAFKFARKWARALGGAGKHEIVAVRGSFHGRLFATLAATDRPSYRVPFRPLAGGVSIAERNIEELSVVLDTETVAALIVEPVQGEGGVRVMDPGFLRELRALTRERKIALILDEIQCGLGRTGTLFAYEHAEIEPDMVTLAKPLAGGLPMGAVLLTQEIASAMQPGEHGTTFGGGPFVASVALHVLERLSDPRLLASVTNNGTWLERSLGRLAEKTDKVRGVRGLGYMWGVDVTEAAGDIVKRAMELGLLVCTAGDHTLRLLPPLVTTRAELEKGLAILAEAINS